MEKLRTMIFKPYNGYISPDAPWFKLITFDAGRTIGGKHRIAYRLCIGTDSSSPWRVLFKGDDFGCSPLHAIDSNAACAALMGFLTLRPGDTDSEYFADYTPAQIEFANTHAEALGFCAEEILGVRC